MTPSFQKLMAQATRHTQAGDLQLATAAIQAALAGMPMPAAGQPATPPAAEIIDVEARVVGTGAAANEASASESASPAGRFIDGHHAGAQGSRSFKLYIPPQAASASAGPLPLVVMLHGCTQNPDDFAAGTAMNEAAAEQGAYVLYPQQPRSANMNQCWNWFEPEHQGADHGEPALLAAMTREVMQQHRIDARRVYVAGLSAGGAMAAILGDTHPELFAAIGVHSGLPVGAASDMKSAFVSMKHGGSARPRHTPPPTIVFHGDEDGTVHPVNGERVVAPLAKGTKAEVQKGQSAGRAYSRRIYRRPDGQVAAEHWTVHGAGHAWSGGRTAGSHADSQGPDASRQLLRFFEGQQLAAR